MEILNSLKSITMRLVDVAKCYGMPSMPKPIRTSYFWISDLFKINDSLIAHLALTYADKGWMFPRNLNLTLSLVPQGADEQKKLQSFFYGAKKDCQYGITVDYTLDLLERKMRFGVTEFSNDKVSCSIWSNSRQNELQKVFTDLIGEAQLTDNKIAFQTLTIATLPDNEKLFDQNKSLALKRLAA